MNILTKISELKKSISQKHPQFEDEYVLERVLGEGSFATVYSCKRGTSTDTGFAVKVFDRKSQKGLRRRFREEKKLMQKITTNEHCVQMLDAFEGPQYCHIVLELCRCTIFEAFIKSAKCGEVLTEKDLAHAFKCMLCGVQHLHSCGIVHRDVKPENLLLSQSDSLSRRPVVKLCDLGLAAQLPKSGKLTEICGTELYMAPEMLLKTDGYSSEVDLWACGVTAYLMLLGNYPYVDSESEPKKKEFLELPPRPSIQKRCARQKRFGYNWPNFRAHDGFAQPSAAAIRFLRMLLEREPIVRASCQLALSSEYIRSSMVPIPAQQTSSGPCHSTASVALKLEAAPKPSPLEGDHVQESADESTDCESKDSASRQKTSPRCLQESMTSLHL